MTPTIPAWQYLRVVSDASGLLPESKLNRLGADGWELVCTSAVGGGVAYLFKRPIGGPTP